MRCYEANDHRSGRYLQLLPAALTRLNTSRGGETLFQRLKHVVTRFDRILEQLERMLQEILSVLSSSIDLGRR